MVSLMKTNLTRTGLGTTPKPLRDALGLLRGSAVAVSVIAPGTLVLQVPRAAEDGQPAAPDRFDAVRGQADVPWRTDELMKLLRPAG